MKTPTIHAKRKQRINYAESNPQWAQSSLQAWLGSGVRDKNGTEIFDGDIIQIDFAAAAKLIGEGFLIHDLRIAQPAPDAILVVEFRNARFHVVWRTRNGGVDTGVDLYHIDAIKEFVIITGHISEVRGNETQYQAETA